MNRAEESGIISVKSIKLVALYFENAPVWILGLFPMKIGTIHIPQFASFSDLLYHIQSHGFDSKIYNKYVSLMGRGRFRFGKFDVKVSYLLLLGSTIFLNDQLDTLRHEKIYIYPIATKSFGASLFQG